MSKPKFDPIITRIKLNPEQAVLACTCWSGRRKGTTTTNRTTTTVCRSNTRTKVCNLSTSANASTS